VDEIAAKLLRQLEKRHLWTITDADVVVWKTYLRNVQEQKKQQHVEKMLGGDSNVHYASVQQHAQQLSAPSHQQQPLSLTAQPYFHAVPKQLEPSRFLIAPEQQDVVVWPSNTIIIYSIFISSSFTYNYSELCPSLCGSCTDAHLRWSTAGMLVQHTMGTVYA
jgi:hypothetical protein